MKENLTVTIKEVVQRGNWEICCVWSVALCIAIQAKKINNKSREHFQTKFLILSFSFDLLHLLNKTCFKKASRLEKKEKGVVFQQGFFLLFRRIIYISHI